MRLKSFAKINLGLEVVGRRPDGYHDIRTLFQWVSLCDVLTIEEIPGDILDLSGDDPEVAWDGTNLIARAAESLRERTGVRRGARIRVEKRIPAGRGLAGGSGDAAMTLLGLNALWGLGLPGEDLDGLGRGLGADVPYFFRGGLCLGEGIGDVLTPLPELARRFLVLAVPDFAVPTPLVYRALDEPGAALTSGPKDSRMWRFFETGEIASLGNDLEATIFRFYPQLQEIKRFFQARGAELSLVTGSGSAVYGLFGDRSAAQACLDAATGIGRCLLLETVTREQGWPDIEAGVSPSGKAAGFGPAIRGFESSRPRTRR